MSRFNTQIRVYDVVSNEYKETIQASHQNLREMYEWFELVKDIHPQVTNCNIQVRFSQVNKLAPFKSGYNLHNLMRRA